MARLSAAEKAKALYWASLERYCRVDEKAKSKARDISERAYRAHRARISKAGITVDNYGDLFFDGKPLE